MAEKQRTLQRELFDLAERLLPEFGFRRRQAGLFTTDLSESVLGWLGLNATSRKTGGLLLVNPVVGIRHQPIEQIVAELRQERPHAYQPPTISLPLGSLRASQQAIPWACASRDEIRPTLEDMIEALQLVGIPFMKTHAQLERLANRLQRQDVGVPEFVAYRLPVALVLLGEFDKCKGEIENWLEHISARSDPAAEEFRRFACRLEQNFIKGRE
jgi:hypothetical protein